VKVGDLVLTTLNSAKERHMGIIIKVDSSGPSALDAMFPYFIYFTSDLPNDWYAARSLEVISESR
jgi:hypothetical protein